MSHSKTKLHPIPLNGGLVGILLTKGQMAIVDSADTELSQLNWQAHRQGYATRSVWSGARYIGTQMMHRVIMERVLGRPLEKGEEVDHINGDVHDNRRCNLRLTNSLGNNRNARRRRDNKTGYKGVTTHKDRFRAKIKVGEQQIHLGYFSTAKEAYQAYCEAAKKYHGEYANLG